MELPKFCEKISALQLDQTQIALSILWYCDEKQPNVVMSSGEIAKIVHHSGLGNPNSTQLKEKLGKSKLTLSTTKGFKLKDLSRIEIRSWLVDVLGDTTPEIDQELGYLPQAVWSDTRGYIEKICVQLNGCFQFGFYDACSVLVRRIIETLIIECYEKQQRLDEIRNNGQIVMLSGLISRASDPNGLTLGRDAQKLLSDIKELGDRSAHNRRYNAVKADLEKVQSGFRVAVDEMINLADLRKKTSNP